MRDKTPGITVVRDCRVGGFLLLDLLCPENMIQLLADISANFNVACCSLLNLKPTHSKGEDKTMKE